MTDFFVSWLGWGIVGVVAVAINLSPLLMAAFAATLVESWLDDPARRARFSSSKTWITFAVFFAVLLGSIPLITAAVVFLRTGHL